MRWCSKRRDVRHTTHTFTGRRNFVKGAKFRRRPWKGRHEPTDRQKRRLDRGIRSGFGKNPPGGGPARALLVTFNYYPTKDQIPHQIALTLEVVMRPFEPPGVCQQAVLPTDEACYIVIDMHRFGHLKLATRNSPSCAKISHHGDYGCWSRELEYLRTLKGSVCGAAGTEGHRTATTVETCGCKMPQDWNGSWVRRIIIIIIVIIMENLRDLCRIASPVLPHPVLRPVLPWLRPP